MSSRETITASENIDIVACKNISKWFGKFQALKDVSLSVPSGQVVSIVGPSGSGKSTLLRMLNGLETPDSGEIVVDGVSLVESKAKLEEARKRVGMVFQSFNLFPHLTVRENLTLAPITSRRLPKAEADDKAERLLERVHILDQIDKYPTQLSGGQQQRVAIARALAMEPKVMLFDEPTSALDPEMVKEVLDAMLELVGTGMTMLVVTHELGFAREASDRIVFMSDGEIRVDLPPSKFLGEVSDKRLRAFLSKVL